MTSALVSIIVETITSRLDCGSGSLADDVAPTLEAVRRQTYPASSTECIIVVDEEVGEAQREELSRRHPDLRIVSSRIANYFDAKNAGAAAATGAFVALVDGDSVPAPDWLEAAMKRFAPDVAAVAGRTRYSGRTWAERVFSVPDFGYVADIGRGEASGFNINNVIFRREVLLANPFDSRIPRNGGCYFLFHRLRAAGARILYEPSAAVRHGNDVSGLKFVRKHFDRGYDSVAVYRLDDDALLKGTRLFRRFGALALAGFTGRRIILDGLFLLRHRRQIGINFAATPFYWLVGALLRLIELAGSLKAMAARPLETAAAA